MGKIASIQNGPNTSMLTIELTDKELENIETRGPVLVFGQNKFSYDTTTRVVKGGKGGRSDYFLVPTALKKQFKIADFKDSQKFKCCFLESADSQFLVFKWDK